MPDSGEKKFEKAALWLEIPQRCLKVSIHEVMNDDVPVLVGLSPERDMGWKIDKIQVNKVVSQSVHCPLWIDKVHRDKPLVPET